MIFQQRIPGQREKIKQTLPSVKYVYCGRGKNSILGNPYLITKENNRDMVCDEFDTYFKEALLDKDSIISTYIRGLEEESKTKDIVLLCFCKPLRCHTDTIKNYLDNFLKEYHVNSI
jgi:hypothetical protein